jgi:hypothetical protein
MSHATRARHIHLAHVSPGRLRVRLPWMRGDRGAAEALADRLVELDGVLDIQVRLRTGSVLCRFDTQRIDDARVVSEIRRHTGVTIVLRGDAAPPAAARPPLRNGSRVAGMLADLMRDLDAGIADATDGRIDLGALAGIVLLGAGAAEIASAGRIPAPPWFSLAWWAFRTFTISSEAHPPPRLRKLATIPRRT